MNVLGLVVEWSTSEYTRHEVIYQSEEKYIYEPVGSRNLSLNPLRVREPSFKICYEVSDKEVHRSTEHYGNHDECSPPGRSANLALCDHTLNAWITIVKFSLLSTVWCNTKPALFVVMDHVVTLESWHSKDHHVLAASADLEDTALTSILSEAWVEDIVFW